MFTSIILICINLLLLWIIIKREEVHLLLKIIIAVSYIGWNAVPLLLSFSEQNADKLIDKNLYLFCSNVNQLYFIVIFILFLSFLKWIPTIGIFVNRDFQYNRFFIRSSAFIAFIFVIYGIYNNIISLSSYWDANDLENYSEEVGFFSFISHIFLYVLLSIVLFYRRCFSRATFIFYFFVLVIHYIVEALSGARIHLFALVIIFIYFSYRDKSKLFMSLSVGLGILAFVLLPIIGSIRGAKKIDFDDFAMGEESSYEKIVKEVYAKTNSVNTSTVLIKQDGIGGGGSFVYFSTAFALVPRVIMPNKPQPGSKDGTIYGLPSRLAVIYNVGYRNYNDIANVGISSSIEMLWALGWIGLACLAIIEAIVLTLFNQIVRGKKILFLYMFFALLNFPVCQIDVPFSTLLISIQRYVVLTMLLYFVFNTKKYHA